MGTEAYIFMFFLPFGTALVISTMGLNGSGDHDAWFKFQRDKIAAFGAFHLSIFLWNTEFLSAIATVNDGSDHVVASKREYLSCTGGKQRILE